jgi:hypothetical protein
MTGAAIRSASRATPSPPIAPEPAQISGRSAASISATGSPRPDADGRSTTTGSLWRDSVESRSVGTPRYTGRVGGLCARSIASSVCVRIPSASSTVWHAFTTGANIAAWSVVSCSTPRYVPGRRSAAGMSVAMTRIGDLDAQASPTAPSVLAAPGPVVTIATPSLPVARA